MASENEKKSSRTLGVVGVMGVLVADAPNFEWAKRAKFRRNPPFCLFQNKVGCPPCQYKKFKRKTVTVDFIRDMDYAGLCVFGA